MSSSLDAWMLHLTRRFYEYLLQLTCVNGRCDAKPGAQPTPLTLRLTPPSHPLRHFSSLLLADSSSPRMTDDYPSFGDSSLFGANVYYRGTVALGRTGMIPAAHVYEGGLRKVGKPGMSAY